MIRTDTLTRSSLSQFTRTVLFKWINQVQRSNISLSITDLTQT